MQSGSLAQDVVALQPHLGWVSTYPAVRLGAWDWPEVGSWAGGEGREQPKERGPQARGLLEGQLGEGMGCAVRARDMLMTHLTSVGQEGGSLPGRWGPGTRWEAGPPGPALGWMGS